MGCVMICNNNHHTSQTITPLHFNKAFNQTQLTCIHIKSACYLDLIWALRLLSEKKTKHSYNIYIELSIVIYIYCR